MHVDVAQIRARVQRSYSDRVLPARYRASAPVTVTAWETPGEPVPFAEIVDRPFTPLAEGDAWGRPWGTCWLRITATVPADWPATGPVELLVDLGFGAGGPGFQA